MPSAERRASRRRHLHVVQNVFFAALRIVLRHAHGFYTALGIVLIAGAVLSVAATWGFSELAELVREGSTQEFDEAVLHWIGERRSPTADRVMLELTLLGSGIVVMMIVAVAGLFLWLTDHRFSALLLLAATWGGVAMNQLLKARFDRPRPQIFEWGTHALTSSFPSGHAMAATIIYGTVAYLAARLQRRHLTRWITLTVAGILIVLICLSRLYLGVHYPSDLIAGVVMGVAWSAFCMATLEAMRVFGRRFRPAILEHEQPPPDDSDA